MPPHPGRSIAVALALALALAVVPTRPGLAAEGPEPSRTRDVIYGRTHGAALTMDVFRPGGESNGVGLVFVVSGGWFSSHEFIPTPLVDPFVERGYTVFAVVHGSQPKFTIPEILKDMDRAVRFIRHHAGEYGIDPERIGVYGGSAGGHLSLMLGTNGSEGDPDAGDPVSRASGRVQAVAALYPARSPSAGASWRTSGPPSTSTSWTRPATSSSRSPTRKGSWRSAGRSRPSPTSRPTIPRP
jgi:acetyl esterase/lipase